MGKKAEELPKDEKYDKLRDYYNYQAFLTKPDQGNLLEGLAKTPYLCNLILSSGGGPKFNVYSPDKIIETLNKDEKVFDTLMDTINSGEQELRAEYNRQKMAESGWDDQKEQQYLRELKAAHENTIKHYNALCGLQDNKKYDEYLNNPLSQHTGLKLNEGRDLARAVGAMEGEVHAINNGWSSKDMQVLGLIGSIDREVWKKEQWKGLNKEEKEHLQQLRADIDTLKGEIWDKKVTNSQEKAEVVQKVNTFLEQHKNALEVRTMHDKFREIYDSAAEHVATLAAAEKSRNIENSAYNALKAMEAEGNYRGIFDRMTQSRMNYDGDPSPQNTAENNAVDRFLEDLKKNDGKRFLPEAERSFGTFMRELGAEMSQELSNANGQQTDRFVVLSAIGGELSSAKSIKDIKTSSGITGWDFAIGQLQAGFDVKQAETEIRAAGAEQLYTLDQKTQDSANAVIDYQDTVKSIAWEAKKKLVHLDSVIQHDNSKEYETMRRTLETVSKLDGSGNTPAQVHSAITALDKAAAKYERTHSSQTFSGFFKGWGGVGMHRLESSRDLQPFAKQMNQLLVNKEHAMANKGYPLHENSPLKDQLQTKVGILGLIDDAYEQKNITSLKTIRDNEKFRAEESRIPDRKEGGIKDTDFNSLSNKLIQNGQMKETRIKNPAGPTKTNRKDTVKTENRPESRSSHTS